MLIYVMIGSFGDAATADLFHGIASKKAAKVPADIVKTALRKLDMINAASQIDDLRVPPGNRLEKLTGNHEGFHSIRINDQFRITFRWSGSVADQVSIIDYH